jgi:[acyl-carrier-protein] S-malonyltransferase
MKPAAERLAQKLAALDIQAPRIPVLHNVDVQAHANPDEIRAVLKAQLHNPVRWVETVQRLAGDGLTKQFEFGPGRVLVGLAKRIDKSVECLPVYDPTTLQAALAAAGA